MKTYKKKEVLRGEKFMSKLKVMDLFAGAGGLSNGFEQTGQFQVKVAVELDEDARNTYKENHKKNKVKIYEDITKLEFRDNNGKLKEEYRNIDVIIGGPPCQGFSNANRQKNTLISNNNQLIKSYLKAIEEISPDALVMENVSSMGSEKHKFYYSKDDTIDLNNLGIIPKVENIKIGEKTFVSEELISLIINSAQKKEDISPYLLSKNIFSKLNILFKKSRKNEDLIKYFGNRNNVIYFEKLLPFWNILVPACWSKKYEIEWNNLRDMLSEIIKEKESVNSDLLYKTLKVIVETQKVMKKVKEVHDNKIYYERLLFIDGDSMSIKLKTYGVLNYVISKLNFLGYKINQDRYIFNAAEYGVPQVRKRLILVGVKKDILMESKLVLPVPLIDNKDHYNTIYDAIGDLEDEPPEIDIQKGEKSKNTSPIMCSKLNQYLNGKEKKLHNHVRTHTKDVALARFKALTPGQNFHDLDESLKTTYSDHTRTQNTVYKRLEYRLPSDTVLNVRKSMWVHPVKDRALSIREAARLQSFKDNYIFYGSKDSQYQQIGNAVPPLLARVIAECLLESLDIKVYEKVINLLNKNNVTNANHPMNHNEINNLEDQLIKY